MAFAVADGYVVLTHDLDFSAGLAAELTATGIKYYKNDEMS